MWSGAFRTPGFIHGTPHVSRVQCISNQKRSLIKPLREIRARSSRLAAIHPFAHYTTQAAAGPGPGPEAR